MKPCNYYEDDSTSTRKPLFCSGNFVLHSGQSSVWKINCDALTDDDWQTLALMASKLLPNFGSVEGVPRGGLRFAEALKKYITIGPLLIADDVCTTGNSMIVQRAGREAIGVVAFARGKCPPWIRPLLASQEAFFSL